MKINWKAVATIGLPTIIGVIALANSKPRSKRKLIPDLPSIGRQPSQFSIENTIDDKLFHYWNHLESDSKRKITNRIKEILNMEEYSEFYIGATEDKYGRLGTHEKGRFKKLFLLTEVPELSKMEYLETLYINKFSQKLENESMTSTGLQEGAEMYYLYIAVY